MADSIFALYLILVARELRKRAKNQSEEKEEIGNTKTKRKLNLYQIPVISNIWTSMMNYQNIVDYILYHMIMLYFICIYL